MLPGLDIYLKEWAMKQRVRVTGIVRKKNDILLLKRPSGRMEGEPIWELITAKIGYGDQPEEAMARAIDENLGVSVQSMKLKDVVTFVALSGVDHLYNLYIVYDIIDCFDKSCSTKAIYRQGLEKIKIYEANKYDNKIINKNL